MKWERARRSSNVEDRRGQIAVGGAGLGVVGVIVVVLVGLITGRNPLDLLQGQQGPGNQPADAVESRRFVESILGETEDVWGDIYKRRGETYEEPKLILFTRAIRSACGRATSSVGPFYCPGDHMIYIDLSFFDLMKKRLGGGGDFAEAYVIAHEVGHHVQTLDGTSARVDRLRAKGEEIEGANGALVRQELQADCYAGVWGNVAQKRHDWLERGDIEEALKTASAIGDDHLQRQSRGTVVPDSFTHGTSEQRVRWFKKGFESGDPARCDTFGAKSL